MFEIFHGLAPRTERKFGATMNDSAEQRRKQLVEQLRRLLRAYEQHSRASANHFAIGQKVDREFERVIGLLEQDWTTPVDQLLEQTRDQILIEDHSGAYRGQAVPGVFEDEARLMPELRVEASRLEWFYQVYLQEATFPDLAPKSTGELIALLRKMHNRSKELLDASRPLGKKPKRGRKRDIRRGTFALVVSVAAYATNSSNPPLIPWSYGIGAGAALQAARDLLGDRME